MNFRSVGVSCKAFLGQQDGSNVVPCVVATDYICEVGGLANLCTLSARAPKNSPGIGPLSDVFLGPKTRYFGGEVLYSRLYLPRGPSLTGS